MIGGQVMDLDFETRRPEKEELSQMVHLKTGCLLMAACEMGCALAGAGEEEMKKARLYGEKLGLAFQIQDDILDVTGSTEKLGKPGRNLGQPSPQGRLCPYISRSSFSFLALSASTSLMNLSVRFWMSFSAIL